MCSVNINIESPSNVFDERRMLSNLVKADFSEILFNAKLSTLRTFHEHPSFSCSDQKYQKPVTVTLLYFVISLLITVINMFFFSTIKSAVPLNKHPHLKS